MKGIKTYTIPVQRVPVSTTSVPIRTYESNGTTVVEALKPAELKEVSPPGWSGTVKALKKHKEITNPFALAWYMKNKGDKPHVKPEAKSKKKRMKEAASFAEGIFGEHSLRTKSG